MVQFGGHRHGGKEGGKAGGKEIRKEGGKEGGGRVVTRCSQVGWRGARKMFSRSGKFTCSELIVGEGYFFW